jgi:hypothetical protein
MRPSRHTLWISSPSNVSTACGFRRRRVPVDQGQEKRQSPRRGPDRRQAARARRGRGLWRAHLHRSGLYPGRRAWRHPRSPHHGCEATAVGQSSLCRQVVRQQRGGVVGLPVQGPYHRPETEVAPCSLAIVSTSTIANLVDALTQEELIEDPNDFVATHLLALAQNFSVGKAFLLFTRTGLDWTKRFPTIAVWSEGADVRIVTAWWGELARGKMG